MIDDYLNQMATWRHRTGQNEYNEGVFTDQAIAVRWEAKRRLVRNGKGEEVVSEARVLTAAAVEPGDALVHGGREWPVITVSQLSDLDGAEVYREVAV